MAKDVEKKPKKESKHFFKDFKAELKKVIWPTPKQVVKNTVAVITIVLITAVIVFALDLIFEALNTHGVNNLRKLVKPENTITTTEGESDANESSNSNETSTPSENEGNEDANAVEENAPEDNSAEANNVTENSTEENSAEQE